MVERSRDLRDRAFLILMLLVGAAALASGLFGLLVLGDASAPTIFTAVFGVSVLLVSWLFVLPEVMPRVVDAYNPRPAPLRQIAPLADPTGTSARAPSTLSPGPPSSRRAVAAPARAIPAPERVIAVAPAESPPARPKVRPAVPPASDSAASEMLKELDEIYEELRPSDEDRDGPPPPDARRRGLGGPSAG
jgi:hypothetical protein